MADAFNLDRFLRAQDARDGAGRVYDQALAELRAGRKRSHWMWFVFPQLAGLGHSETARRYGLASAGEAAAYLAHPVLGPRLRTCVAAALAIEGRSAREVFGTPDDLKFRSCLTLFARVANDPADFQAALDQYYGGAPDPASLRILGG